jgi:dipeptidase E
MKLYLSSFRLGNDPNLLSAIVGDKNRKAAVVANAIDFHTGKERSQRVRVEIEALSELGFEPEELDLRDYFNKSSKDLENKLSEYGLLWVRGGNTFILRRAMVQSGFDEAIRNLFAKDDIVYGGYSAGICVLSPDFHGIELVDDPNIVPKGYNSEIIWEGVGLIDFAIAPHYRSDHPESADVEKEVAYYKKHKIPYKALRDGQVILANNYETKIVS